MIDIGIQDNIIEILDDIEFYCSLRSQLALQEKQVDDNRITLFFQDIEQHFELRLSIDDLDIINNLPKKFERMFPFKFRIFTEISFPSWYYIDEVQITRHPDQDEGKWLVHLKVCVSLKEKPDA